MPTLLIVDDEPNVLYSVKRGLESETLEVITAETARGGIELARERNPDVMILDVRLPDMSGLDAFGEVREIDPRLPVIIVTAYAATETAIEAMKRGAFEYLLKPVNLRQLRDVVDRAVELSRLRHVPAVFDDANSAVEADRIVGNSPMMQEVYKAIGRVAPQDVAVLILGESGTGKELVARAIYHHSRRSEGPFLAINCAAIPETLLESELFGHERGAFTGAETRRIGKFEQADGGTIFLDELGDMSGATQAKMLRLLQDGRFERVGGNETIHSDVRLVAATNQNLEAMVEAGEFRADLFYRLNVFTIYLPPLRKRPEDIPVLLEYFVPLFNRSLGKNVRSLSPETQQLLQTYAWPGNIRELQSVLKYAMVHAVGDVLTPDCLPPSFRQQAAPAAAGPKGDAERPFDVRRFVREQLQAGESEIYRRLLAEVDRIALGEVLRHVAGNRGQASELLGMSRTTLRAKLAGLGPDFEQELLSDTDSRDVE